MDTRRFQELPLSDRRRRLQLSFHPSDVLKRDFILAAQDPALRAEAIRRALGALRRGNLSFFFIPLWVPPAAGRAAVIAAARKAPPKGRMSLVLALGHVGGPEAKRILLQLWRELPLSRSARETFRNPGPLRLAGSVLRLDPGNLEAAELLIEALGSPDDLVRSQAANCIRDAYVPGVRGPGVERLRGHLRRLLRAPPTREFFQLEDHFQDLSLRRFLHQCESLLSDRSVGDMAVDRLIRLGGAGGRRRVLEHLLGTKDFDTWIVAMGALGRKAPRDLLMAVLRRGLRRPSPFDRNRTLWLLSLVDGDEEVAELVRRALAREPDSEIRLLLGDELRRLEQGPGGEGEGPPVLRRGKDD